tara:strand:- start:1107 stop:1226 length:120 start_codon:yes stop_codon:yes gene_type:complete
MGKTDKVVGTGMLGFFSLCRGEACSEKPAVKPKDDCGCK